MYNSIFAMYNIYDEGMGNVCLRDFFIGYWESDEE